MLRYFNFSLGQYWQQALLLPSEVLRSHLATGLGLGSPVAIWWCVITCFSVALAQPVEVNNAPQTKYRNIKGRIHSFDAKRINVLTEDQQAWQVELTEGTVVEVKGKASAALLQPQLQVAVRFYAEVNDRAMTVVPVKKMTIFSPRKFFQPRIEESTDQGKTTQSSETEQSRDQGTSSAAAQSQGESTQETEIQGDDQTNKPTSAERRRRRDRSRAKVKKPGTRYYIAGILKSFQPKKGRFVVDVGQAGAIRGSVAADVVVEVDFTSHQFARPGDHILADIGYTDYGEAGGQRRPSGQPQQGAARKISITLADPTKDQPLPEGRDKKNRSDRRR